MAIPTRTLGKNGPSVPALGFGLMSIGGIYGAAPSNADRLALLDHAHAIGSRFWDTADVYFDSEDAIGEWIRQNPDKRKDIFLATKFALQMDPATGAQTVRSDPEYVKEACEKSLKRLGTDYIDLYYCHRVDGKTPIEKTVEAMVELKNERKIHYIGLSEVSASTLRRAHAVHPISAVQVEYSPFALDIEDPKVGVLQTARELGITIVAYSPMGRGLLTGRYNSYEDVAQNPFLSMMPRFSKDNFPKILELIKKIRTTAAQKGCTVGQLTMAWMLSRGDDIIPIPGTRSIKYLDENFATLQVKLSPEDYKELTEAVMATTLDGARYPAGFPDNYELGETPAL
ncbi:aldo-keto reductase (AKR13), putative [Paecilomyces variotii No. 5]|uniref:Aldo-keto reductase (AKR13), putative n=1 Tax=Byssochlamys spectabilis (strain No. 5 / NBRC 109023) TaxID=1356009 RepID=V5G6C3_BYSSN|nr:aldo-keto reductase (AKR13), putative [Paecilomyces variotii No. 5]